MNESRLRPIAFLVLGFATAVFLPGCEDEEGGSSEKIPGAQVTELLGDEAVFLNKSGSKVEVYAVDPYKPRSAKPKVKNEKRIDGYLVGEKATGEIKSGPGTPAEKAKEFLWKDETYKSDPKDKKKKKKSDCFHPDTAIRIVNTTEKRTADVLIDFDCMKLTIVIKDTTNKDKEEVVAKEHGYFNKEAHDGFLKLAKEALKENKNIQKHKDLLKKKK